MSIEINLKVEAFLIYIIIILGSPLSEAVQAFNQNQSIGSSPDLSQHRRIKEEATSVPVLPPPLNPLLLPSQITVTTVPLTNGDSVRISRG